MCMKKWKKMKKWETFSENVPHFILVRVASEWRHTALTFLHETSKDAAWNGGIGFGRSLLAIYVCVFPLCQSLPSRLSVLFSLLPNLSPLCCHLSFSSCSFCSFGLFIFGPSIIMPNPVIYAIIALLINELSNRYSLPGLYVNLCSSPVSLFALPLFRCKTRFSFVQI